MANRVTQVAIEVLVTGSVNDFPDPIAPHDCCGLREFYNPEVVLLNTGQPGFLVRAMATPFNVLTDRKVYFIGYTSESTIATTAVKVFDFDTIEYGIVNWHGVLVACAWDPADQIIKYRTSTNDGVSWTAQATMIPAQAARAYHPGGNAGNGRGIRLTKGYDGNTLYLFYRVLPLTNTNQLLVYRSTTNADPSLGWSAETSTGFTIFSIGRNYGGPTARNQGDMRPYSGPLETYIPGTWVVGAESDDGDFHANHAIMRGTLGGAWTRVLQDGLGGGLSGSQGSNGSMWYDKYGDLLCSMMDTDGAILGLYHSADAGASWVGSEAQIPTTVTVGMGQHDGIAPAGWLNDLGYLWGGIAGLDPVGGYKKDLYMVIAGEPADFTDVLGEEGTVACASSTNPFMPPARAVPTMIPHAGTPRTGFATGRPSNSVKSGVAR